MSLPLRSVPNHSQKLHHRQEKEKEIGLKYLLIHTTDSTPPLETPQRFKKVTVHVQEQSTGAEDRDGRRPNQSLEILGTAAYEVGNWTPFGRLALSPGARERHRERTTAEPPSSPMDAFRQPSLALGTILLFIHLRETPPTSPPIRFIPNSHKG
jgi:hypothetical protein